MSSKTFYSLIILSTGLICCTQSSDQSGDWCTQPLRPEFSRFAEVQTTHPWFRVYQVGDGVFAIAEPYNFQEVISYLIVGSERNILFDTGMGMDRISAVVKELSPLPVIVINSHTHYDHIGGNHEFDTVYAVDTAYTKKYSGEGWPHERVKQEVTKAGFCFDKLPGLDTASYFVEPYQDKIMKYIAEGDTINLGNRTIEVMQVPGHTPDCVALLDRSAGYLWTGDMYYESTIWLFFDGTDLDAYERSIARFASLSPELKSVFPAHNKPTAIPSHLVDLHEAFASIRNGEKKPALNKRSAHPEDDKALMFEFEYFKFLIRKDQLKQPKAESQ